MAEMNSETESGDVAAQPMVNKKRFMTGSSDDEDIVSRRKKRRNVNNDLLDSDDASNKSLGNNRSDSQENTSRTMPSLPKLTSKVTGKARTGTSKEANKAESIPKKKTAIPKKKDSQGTPVKSSLLTQMAAPSKAPPLAAPSKSPPRGVPRRTMRPKPEPKVEAIKAPELSKEQKLRNFLSNQETATGAPPNRSSHLETVVMKDLQDLCGRVSLKLACTGLDMSGSFLERSADYFDTNKKGEIVITARPPVFPEDFAHKQASRDLSWWGILDPGVTDGAARNGNPPPSREERRPRGEDRRREEKRRWEDERRRREEDRRREEGRRREDDRWRDRRRYDGPQPPPDFRGPPPPNYGRR